jgi:hypothetical protein
VEPEYEADLADLRHHWGSAYFIEFFARPGLWLAQRRDTRETLKAGDADALRDLIIADYAARPVER